MKSSSCRCFTNFNHGGHRVDRRKIRSEYGSACDPARLRPALPAAGRALDVIPSSYLSALRGLSFCRYGTSKAVNTYVNPAVNPIVGSSVVSPKNNPPSSLNDPVV